MNDDDDDYEQRKQQRFQNYQQMSKEANLPTGTPQPSLEEQLRSAPTLAAVFAFRHQLEQERDRLMQLYHDLQRGKPEGPYYLRAGHDARALKAWIEANNNIDKMWAEARARQIPEPAEPAPPKFTSSFGKPPPTQQATGFGSSIFGPMKK